VAAPGWASNARRRDGSGHKEQRDATTDPINSDKRDAPGDRDQAKPGSN
jgi:hypothetical protein